MAQKIEMDMQPLENPRWKRRSQLLWKGDTINGWQICLDPKRTNGNLGLVMPIIINHPTGGQFTSMTAVEKPELDENGEQMLDPVTREPMLTTETMPTWQYKGFRPAAEARGKKASQEIVDLLVERHCKEIDQTLEGKMTPEQIADEKLLFRTMVYRANGMEDPEKDVREQIREEKRKVK